MPASGSLPGSGIRDPGSDPGTRDSGGSFDVKIEATDLCPRYCAQVFSVTIAPSPDWLQRRLEAAGVRPINNVVDVTNYVMLEIGQPMHAFDLERLAKRRIVVRRARAKEPMRTLDGIDRTLDADMLVIADAERALAIGGVMGGSNSEISPTTRTIALESAYFEPSSVRRTSKRLGLKTEASARFERGADIGAPPSGIARAAELFVLIGAGFPSGHLIDRYPARRQAREILLRSSRIARLLGHAVPPEDVPRYLEPLGFGLRAAQRPSRVDGDGALVPRGRHARRGFDRGGRPALRIRSAACPVSGTAGGAAGARSPHCTRPPDPPGAHVSRFFRIDDVCVHRTAGRAALL
jgi:phenylalanyl-tRNA synthetase beta chain